MSYYKRCPFCGAHLDPGEKCDCESTDRPEIEDRQIGREKSITPVADDYSQRRASYDYVV